MRLSIIIAAHNERELLLRTLQSVSDTAAGLDVEILVVEDGLASPSHIPETRPFATVRRLSFQERRGPAAAKDAGAQAARGDVLLFLDAHTKPERGALQQLLEDVEDLNGQAIVVPQIPALDTNRWENIRRQMGQGYVTDLLTFQCSWKPLHELQPSPLNAGLYESPALIGCAFAISRSLYEKLWGQDRSMADWGCEDIDLGLKAWLLGHPVLLNLFDEGWIVDQRGVKASADRAIFILTTNAGDRNIAQMTRTGKSDEEITEHVKQTLSKVRHERSSQPVFPPAFLARIGRIVVFNPLEEPAMIGIAQRICQKLQRTWQQKRQQELTIPEELIEQIGKKGHELNEHSGGREGGRIIRKLVADAIDSKLQTAALKPMPALSSAEFDHLQDSTMRHHPPPGNHFRER